RLVERDRHLEHEVVAAPLVQLRRLDPGDDEEVARWSAAPAGLPLALEPDLGAVAHARGDTDRVALRSPLAAGAVAGRAGRLDDRPVAATGRAGLLEGEEALRGRHHTRAVALRTALRRGSGGGPRPVARVAGELERH